ncbi:MAG TPA: MFS transporter [Micromonosporaceae bacterium]|nr:MFS transporter [Micromonosporaceae bacterium]
MRAGSAAQRPAGSDDGQQRIGLRSESGGRNTAGLLRDRVFGPYFVGSLVSNTGTWFQNVAAILTIFALTNSGVMVGLVTAMQFVMQFVAAPWMGAVADRLDRRSLILAGQVLGAGAAGTLAALAFLDTLTPGLILTFIALSGVGQAVTAPAAQALVPNLVRADEVPQAIALHSLTFNLSRAIGPVAGAATYALTGAGAAFLVNAASYLIFIVALLRMPVARSAAASRRGAGLALLGGVTYVRHRPELLRYLLAVALVAFAMEPVATLSPLFARGFGGEDLLVGVFITCFGAGAALIAGWVGSLRRSVGGGRAGALGMLTLAAGMVVLAASPDPIVASAGLVIGGAGYLLAVSDVTTSLQQGLTDEVRGRVMALWSMAFLGIRPGAAVLHGWLGDSLSASAGALVGALAAVVAAVVVVRGRRSDGAVR